MLYLASRSPRRRWLLRRLGAPFRVVRSTYQETIRPHEPPAVNAKRNAAGKARNAVVPTGSRGIVIGADTFLYFQRRIIGKPKTLAAARRLLRRLRGRSHWVYTGLCLRELSTGRLRTSVVRTKVTFRQLTDAQLARLLPRMGPLDKAGGYALQACLPRRCHVGSRVMARRRQADAGKLIARLEGSRTNVIGLPLEQLRRELARLAGHDCC